MLTLVILCALALLGLTIQTVRLGNAKRLGDWKLRRGLLQGAGMNWREAKEVAAAVGTRKPSGIFVSDQPKRIRDSVKQDIENGRYMAQARMSGWPQ